MRRRGPGHQDSVPLFDGPREAGEILPHRPAQRLRTTIRPDFSWIGRREVIEVVTQVARCGQKGWLPVFVTTSTGDRIERRDGRGNFLETLIVPFDVEHPLVVVQMFAEAQPGTDDHTCHRRRVQHVPSRDIGHRSANTRGSPLHGPQKGLELGPSTCRVDEPFVLHLRPSLEVTHVPALERLASAQ